MRMLFGYPLFSLGLLLRLGLIAGVLPAALTRWYLPFLDVSTSKFTLDPWARWLAVGGEVMAFPYGYAMWCALLPATLLTKAAGMPLQWAYGVTLLVADITLLVVLNRLIPGRQRLLLAVYWLSPIVLLASYGLGLNDLVPVALLSCALLCMRQPKSKLQSTLRLAGVFCAAAISAKLSMVVALPFFAIYLYNNRALRQRQVQFYSGFVLTAALLGLPFLLSGAGMHMLLSNPEMSKVYRLAVDLGGGIQLYLVPLMYLVMLYVAWRIRRLNFDLFQAITGMAFLLIVLMTPGSPGWVVWSVPFLVLYQAMSGRIAMVLIAVFSALYVLSTLLTTELHGAQGQVWSLGPTLNGSVSLRHHVVSLLQTAMVAVGVVLAIRMGREAISRNDFFRLSRKPFVIGIAGDSGSGKDTFAETITRLFGAHSVVTLSGDDYHLWDRQKPMWQVMTHLNPMANDLEGYSNDLMALTDGKRIQSRHYDHQTGRMSKPVCIESNDFIIASGLHALYLPMLRDCYSLKIFLDIDEGLRRHFKILRDVSQRGQSLERVLNALVKREPDSDRFIRPQAQHADLVFSLQPIHPRMLDDLNGTSPLRLKLVIKTKPGFNELALNRVLVGVCGLHVDLECSGNGAEVQMCIEGETSAADIAMAAEMLCPRVLEFLDTPPVWQDGMAGLMQLITLSHISQALTKRFI